MIFKQNWIGKNCRTGESFACTVPGNIQYDFGIYKDFGDVNYSTNCEKYAPYEDDGWEYSTRLSFDKKQGDRIFFVSQGIIYKYDISLNGEKIYSYEGMYKPFELDLTNMLKGDDLLTVYVYPHPKSKTGKAGTRDEADESCMPPVCYGWDWNPRLLVSGIWEDAYIETRSKSYIGDVEVLASLNDAMDEGIVSFSYRSALNCRIALYDADGNEVASAVGGGLLKVKSPKLWWCNGQGEPYLYTYEITNGEEKRSGKIGFRKIRLVRNANSDGPREFPKGRYEAPITVEINGRRIFSKGSNWVNPDLFWGIVEDERLEKLVSLACECNMNLFRMWGGAGLAKQSFYDLCDEYGIMVWQEFPLACNNYKGNQHYMEVLESEAEAIVKKLRRHPSLAIWCGGNELFNSWSGMDDQSAPLRLLNSVCFKLDPKRPFLMTSPLFGMAHGGYAFYLDRQGGEVFNEFIKSDNTAYTEFGVPSISSPEALRRAIPADELFPPKPTASWVVHHGFNAWLPDTWLCLPTIEKYFGESDSIEALSGRSSWLQCEGYRAAFEEMRKQWPRCSMAINWCYNEPWITAGNNSIVSYPAEARPSYDYVKNALRPTLFSARIKKFMWNAGEIFDPEVWLLNDSNESVSAKVSASLKIGDETIKLIDWTGETEARKNLQGPTVRIVLPDVTTDRIMLVLESEEGLSSTYTLRYEPMKAEKPTYRIPNL